MSVLQPDAAASIGQAARHPHLHVVRNAAASGVATPEEPAVATPPARSVERVLLDQWRDTHWTLRLRLREVARQSEYGDVECLYDAARRADNLLTEFHQLRADHLARRLRTALSAAGAGTDGHAPGPEPVDGEEQALLAYFRALAEEDRASLLRLASRLQRVG